MTDGAIIAIQQRLKQQADDRKEDFQQVLSRYGLERILYRLSQSPHAEKFVLKGATLFVLWTGQTHRPTRDLDLLGSGNASMEHQQQVFQEICSQAVVEDGLTFPADAVKVEPIKEQAEYPGIRLRIDARLGKVRIPLQIDIGFGDAVTPEAEEVDYPTLLEFPAPHLKAYHRETVIAEKFHAMVHLGIANSRMKDFYDIWTLAQGFEFDGATLCRSLQATFERRQTVLPVQTPLAFTAEFHSDRAKGTQWTAFLKKGKLVAIPPPLSTVVQLIESFLMPPTEALTSGRPWTQTWRPTRWE